VAGSAIGAAAGALIPFDFEGIGFSLTALFVVLLIEQIRRVFAGGNLSPSLGRRLAPFVISAPAAVLAVFFLPLRLSLLSALVLSLILVQIFDGKFRGT
jgi:predicted branched-subunit amino acid permease